MAVIAAPLFRHSRIVHALVLREIVTRYGREGLGFLWLIAEPLVFCFGVLLLWTMTKPEYEHGVRVAPFVMTGYMSLILCRHLIGAMGNAIQGNIGLLHHRNIAPMHIFIARSILELVSTTAAFVVVYVVLLALGQVNLPPDPLLLYGGWLILFWVGNGFALMLTGLALRFEVMERVVPLISYALIPISGAFMMVAWLPPNYQEIFLYIPFPHGIEMIRAGVFGEFVATRYDAGYALVTGSIMNISGLLLISGARDRIDVE